MNKSFAELLNNFFTIYLPLEVNASDNTILSYKYTFKLLITYIVENKKLPITKIEIETLNRDIIRDFLNHIEEKTSISTRNQRLGAIKSFINYIKIENPNYLLNVQSILTIRNKKDIIKEMDYLTVEEMGELFKLIDIETKKGRRDLVLLTLLYDSAARISELTQIKVLDLQLDENPKIILYGKGRKYRNIPIMNDTKEMIIKYINENKLNKESFLFSNAKGYKITARAVQKIINKYINKMDINKKISPHSFRRSRAMHLLEAKVNIVYIRDLLGHSSIITTERYAKANEKIKRDAIANAYPENFPKQELTSWNKDAELLKDLLSL